MGLPSMSALSRWLGTLATAFSLIGISFGQTAATGALTGVVLDPSGAALPGLIVEISQQAGGEKNPPLRIGVADSISC